MSQRRAVICRRCIVSSTYVHVNAHEGTLKGGPVGQEGLKRCVPGTKEAQEDKGEKKEGRAKRKEPPRDPTVLRALLESPGPT